MSTRYCMQQIRSDATKSKPLFLAHRAAVEDTRQTLQRQDTAYVECGRNRGSKVYDRSDIDACRELKCFNVCISGNRKRSEGSGPLVSACRLSFNLYTGRTKLIIYELLSVTEELMVDGMSNQFPLSIARDS